MAGRPYQGKILIPIRLNLVTDKDILSFLEQLPNKNAYIKGLIRADMRKCRRKTNVKASAVEQDNT